MSERESPPPERAEREREGSQRERAESPQPERAEREREGSQRERAESERVSSRRVRR